MNSAEFVTRLNFALNCLCRIEIPFSTFRGNGFLVGPTTVLTNWHVAELINVLPDPAQAGVVFPKIDGKQLSVAPQWRIADSPSNALDFALIALSRAASNAWLELLPRKPEEADHIWILHHAPAADSNMRFGAIRGVSALRGIFLHDAKTEPGWSGCPVFNDDGALIGIHQGGVNAGTKEAVWMSSIWEQLHREKQLDRIPAPQAAPADKMSASELDTLKRAQLASCKQAHEVLHNLQFKFSALRQLEDSFPRSQSHREAELFVDEMVKLRSELERIFASPVLETLETKSVSAPLARGLDILQRSLATRDATAFSRGLDVIDSMLDLAPATIDQQLRTAAVDCAPGQDLTVKIMEHKTWQFLDTQLRYFERSRNRSQLDQPTAWKVLRMSLDSVLALDPSQAWVKELSGTADVLAAAAQQRDDVAISNSFNELQTRARLQFLQVDKDLRRLCEAIQ